MDSLLRGVDAAREIRVVTAVTTEMAVEGCRRHSLRGVEALALARALTAGCLLATLTKHDEERVRLAITGGGAIHRILVDARGDGTARACLRSRLDAPVDPGPEGIRPFVGRQGQILIRRDLGLPQPYEGVVPLTSGEIDEDIERYLERSEQLPSVLRCRATLGAGGKVLRAAGALVQTFPGGAPERLAVSRDALAGLEPLLSHPRTPGELMGVALGGDRYETMREDPLRYHCGCGRDRALGVLSTLGAQDLEALAGEQETTEVRCEFCGDAYEVSREDVLALAQTLREQRS